jgi:hypothetical protein
MNTKRTPVGTSCIKTYYMWVVEEATCTRVQLRQTYVMRKAPVSYGRHSLPICVTYCGAVSVKPLYFRSNCLHDSVHHIAVLQMILSLPVHHVWCKEVF